MRIPDMKSIDLKCRFTIKHGFPGPEILKFQVHPVEQNFLYFMKGWDSGWMIKTAFFVQWFPPLIMQPQMQQKCGLYKRGGLSRGG